jgi:tRNA(Ile2) C34 agmatinyltransferase TiaS
MDITPHLLPVREVGDIDDLVDDAVGFAPNCPRCLRTCDAWQAGSALAWRCPDCALALIG